MSSSSTFPPSSRSSTPLSSDSGETARLRRQLAAVQEQLATLSGKKRKADDNPLAAARGIRKAIALYEPLHNLILEVDRRADNPEALPTPEQEILFDMYKRLAIMLPEIKNLLKDDNQDALNTFLSKAQTAANDARADDVGRMRAKVGTWLNKKFDLNFTTEDRVGRGLQNDETGRLLCDIGHDWDDLHVRSLIRNNAPGYEPGSSFFVNLFYEGYSGDPDNLEAGYLKSVFLLKGFAAIFTSPSSADQQDDQNQPPPLKKKKTTKADVATRIGLNKKVTPPTIAYTAVMVHFNCTDAESWTECYNGMDYPELYNFIVAYFNAPTGTDARKRSDELLSWWTAKIFPETVRTAMGGAASSRARLAAQRGLSA